MNFKRYKQFPIFIVVRADVHTTLNPSTSGYYGIRVLPSSRFFADRHSIRRLQFSKVAGFMSPRLTIQMYGRIGAGYDLNIFGFSDRN
jgi:hypothetical protein